MGWKVSKGSPSRSPRSELLENLLRAGRQLSGATIMFHQTVADRLGLNPTDHKCVDLLLMKGPMTAGELADSTGLTTGAITGAIDRLEQAGFVRREDDPSDRRRVIVRVVPRQVNEISRLFEPLAAATAELSLSYKDGELVTILDFMNRSREMLHQATLNLRQEQEETSADKKQQGKSSGRRRGGP
jgi:DNA-binding MarR family transcriptional regulator